MTFRGVHQNEEGQEVKSLLSCDNEQEALALAIKEIKPGQILKGIEDVVTKVFTPVPDDALTAG